MEKAIFDGTIKTVVVWKLDRISRRLKDGINLLADWCERGVRVVSITQQIDLSGPVGRMVASVMFGLAEIELEYRRERQHAGIAVAKTRGVYRGRQKGTTKSKPNPGGPAQEAGIDDPGDCKCTRCQRKDRVPTFDLGAPLLLPAPTLRPVFNALAVSVARRSGA